MTDTTEAIRAAGGEIIFGGQVAFADESQFLVAAALVRPLVGEGTRYKLLLAAEEFDGIADKYKQQGHDSGSESAKCRAYELREIARSIAATPQAGSSNPAGMTEAQKETLLGLIKQVCPTDAASQPQAQAAVGEPFGWLWQHEETGNTGFIDAQQVEWGWQAANPRCKLVRPLYTAPQPSPAGAVPDWIDEVINRRAAIEQELFNMVKRGESASPEQLRDIAIRLGTPRPPTPKAPS